MQMKMCCISDRIDRVDYAKKFLTYMEQLRRDVLRKRGMFGGDPTTNAQRVLNVALTSNFKFIHLVSRYYNRAGLRTNLGLA